MKKIIFIFPFFLLASCTIFPEKNKVSTNGECIENVDFKKEYFLNIKMIDSLIYKNQNDQFKKSLQFMSKYSHVSFESTLNYARLYTGGAYEKDRKVWLDWYEKNKCNNIQFKK